MAKKELAAPAKRGSKVIKVINVIFWINLVLLVLVGVFVCMAYTIPSLHDALIHWSVADNFVQWLVPQVKTQLVDLMHLPFPARSLTEVQTSILYTGIWGLYIFTWFWLMYLPFVVKDKAKRKGVTSKWHFALCYISSIIALLFFVGYVAFPYQNTTMSWLNGYFTLMYRWIDLFKAGGPMAWFSIPGYLTNPFTLAGIFVLLAFIIVDICLLVPVRFGPKKAAVPAIGEPLPDFVPVAVSGVDNSTVPVAVTATPVVVEKKEKLIPTIRELAVLNSLEPIEPSPVSNLPGLYDTDIEKLVNLLEPQIDSSLICNDGVEAYYENEYHESILPGIDEWDANPWIDEENVVINVAEEKEPEIVIPEPILPEEKDEIVVEAKEEVTETAAPVIIPVPVEETNDVVADDSPKGFIILNDNSHEKVSAPEVSKDNLWIIPSYVETDEPIVEETVHEEKTVEEPVVEEVTGFITLNDNGHYDNLIIIDNERDQKEAEETSRIDFQTILVDNTHEEVISQTYLKDNYWNIPGYVPAKPVTPNKPVASVKQVELKKVNIPTAPANKPKIAPIAPVIKEAPVEEAPVEEVKKPIIPIVAPLHSTEKSRHEKIQVVEAKKVPFSLRHYKIKTYAGDLSPQEAFEKGITKVQPIAVPIFNNQSITSDWKEKRRQDDIRKNGYVNVSQVEHLDGHANISSLNPAIAAPTSIREMVKAQKKNTVQVEEEKKEEFKLAKPTAPINFKPVEPMKKEEEKKEEPVNNNVVKPVMIKPLAPLAKPNKRPDIKPIKPIDPLKKK